MVVNKLYKNLMEHWNKYGYSVYKNQDLSEAGKNDCEELYLNDPLEAEVKNQLATELIEMFFGNNDRQYVDDDIINYLNSNPLVRYYFAFEEKLNVYIKEGLISKNNIFSAAQNYLLDSDDVEGIKFALSLLRYCANEEAEEILKAFSNHNEFIFYCIEGLKEYDKCNSIIFEIAKASRGYGKIMAITNLEYINEEIKKWVIEAEADNEMLETVLVAMTYNNDYYIEYFFGDEYTEEKYNLLTKKLKELYTLKGFFIEHITIDIVYGYWNYYRKFGKNFNSLYVMCELLSLFLKEDKDDVQLMEVISMSSDDKIKIEEMKNIIMSDNNDGVIKSALSDESSDVDEIVDIALAINVCLQYGDFEERLWKDSSQVSIYNYIMTECDKESKEKLIEFAKVYLDIDRVTGGAEPLDEENLDYRYIVDSCLYLIVSYMNELKDKYIDINIKALSARYTPTRRAALNNLRGINYEYLNNYIHIIEGCYKREVNKELKQSIIRFLDGLNSKKKRQYENIGDVRVSPYTKDAFLTITKVEDMDKFDLTIVENKIRSGALVYLKRDKDNAEAENAIMVLTEKGYLLGYVSKENNYILKNLMDWGKILYGQIKKVDEDYKSMEIKVYLSYVDVMREVKDTFNMVTDQSMGYLN